MNFSDSELGKLEKVLADCGSSASMLASFQTPHGTMQLDLMQLLMELKRRTDSLLHFVDPTSQHHTHTPVERTPKPASANPTGQEGMGGP